MAACTFVIFSSVFTAFIRPTLHERLPASAPHTVSQFSLFPPAYHPSSDAWATGSAERRRSGTRAVAICDERKLRVIDMARPTLAAAVLAAAATSFGAAAYPNFSKCRVPPDSGLVPLCDSSRFDLTIPTLSGGVAPLATSTLRGDEGRRSSRCARSAVTRVERR